MWLVRVEREVLPGKAALFSSFASMIPAGVHKPS